MDDLARVLLRHASFDSGEYDDAPPDDTEAEELALALARQILGEGVITDATRVVDWDTFTGGRAPQPDDGAPGGMRHEFVFRVVGAGMRRDTGDGRWAFRRAWVRIAYNPDVDWLVIRGSERGARGTA
jgi:hypothetical protein